MLATTSAVAAADPAFGVSGTVQVLPVGLLAEGEKFPQHTRFV
jgi:hypothetical protein